MTTVPHVTAGRTDGRFTVAKPRNARVHRAVMSPDFGGLTPYDLDLCTLELKIGIPLTCAVRNVYANFDFSVFLCFRVTSPYGTDGRTDRRATRIMRSTVYDDSIIIYDMIATLCAIN